MPFEKDIRNPQVFCRAPMASSSFISVLQNVQPTVRRRIGFGLCTVSMVLALALGASDERPLKSVEQEQFEDWFLEREAPQQQQQQQQAETQPVSLPKITLSMTSTHSVTGTHNAADPRTVETWSLDPVTDPATGAQVLRMLALVREAKLLSLPPSLTEDSVDITLLIEGKDHHFRADFSPDQLEGNIPAQLFLKLFQLYAFEQKKAPVLAGSLDEAKAPEPAS